MVRRAVARWKAKRTAPPRAEAGARRTPPEKKAGTGTSAAQTPAARMETELEAFLAARYEFRFNLLTEATEFRRLGEAEDASFRLATERDLNALCVEAHRAGVNCWDRDVARLVGSAHVAGYHPFRRYFDRLPEWDGRDRLRALAARVCGEPWWAQAFHRWMLGVAAQWAGVSDGLHAQCVAPLLVSDAQGMGKSTFCRALMPPELQAYYTDNVDLARPDRVERQLVEMGLLPAFEGTMTEQPTAALYTNDSGRFECRPTVLRNDNRGKCLFTREIPEKRMLMIPSAHAEGKLMSMDPDFVQKLEDNDQVVFRYVCPDGSEATYPWNPNGSPSDIAGICNPAGNVLGMMPHPERVITRFTHPDWTRGYADEEGDGKVIFRSVISALTN